MNKETFKEKLNQTKQAVQKKKRDGSLTYLFIFILLLVFVVGRAFIFEQPQNGIVNKSTPEKTLSFSDVIKSDIATMNIRENTATGELKDGTKYTATIAYDPELLAKISNREQL